MPDNDFDRAYQLWTSFKNEVLYKNRFIVNHEVLDHVKRVADSNKTTIEQGKILYRARVFTADTYYLTYLKKDWNEEGLDVIERFTLSRQKHEFTSRNDSGFWGYDAKESFVPESNDYINDGRANPAFIKYLYTAEKPYTALAEVRPYLNSMVSIAEIQVDEDITVADFSIDSFAKFNGFERNLMFMIMEDFSTPSDADKKSYIPCQYIAEFIKTLGNEGIKFNSSLHTGGRNITIFNYEKCKPVGSKLYKIEDICFEAKSIAPLNGKDIMHDKLDYYHQEMKRRAMRSLLESKNRFP
jgi:hypothetical protein